MHPSLGDHSPARAQLTHWGQQSKMNTIMKKVAAKFGADLQNSSATKDINECIAKAVRAYEDSSATTTEDEGDDDDEDDDDDSQDSPNLAAHFDPNCRTQFLTHQEKRTMAYSLASEVAGFFLANKFGECFYLLQNTMTEELLHLLPPKIRLNCRLNFQLGNFFLWPLNFNLMFNGKLSHWSIDTLLQPETLTTVTEHLLAFTFDLTTLDGVRKRPISDASRLVEYYLLMEPAEINGFNGQTNERWFTVIERQAKARALEIKAPFFRRCLSGARKPDTYVLIELINPALIVKMFTFIIIRTSEKIRKHKRTIGYFNSLP